MLTVKPLNRFLPEDWHRNLLDLRVASSETRDASFALRQETKHLTNELENKGKWDYEDNLTRLQDRVYEITKVKEDLANSLEQVKFEIERLRHAKEVAERDVEAHLMPIKVSLECLALRERRRDGDLVKDDVEIQLKEELKMLERSRSTLEKLVLDAVISLRVLQNSKQRLEADLKDKDSAIKIDSDQSALNEFSPSISFKPAPKVTLQDALVPCGWLEHSTNNMKDADFSVKCSQQLREKICIAIQKTRREDHAQTRTTDFTLRCRLHQEIRARDELQWERENLVSEIGGQEREISSLEASLNHSMLPLKVAQTRLENRKWRERKDLVEDAAHEGLRREVSHLRTSRDYLRRKVEAANESLHALQNKLRLIDADLVRKNFSVNLENKCHDTRNKLHMDDSAPTLTERNLIQTGSLRPHPTYILH